MSNDSDISKEPHRVIYWHKGNLTSRVFPNLEQANEFAAAQIVHLIQPAKEPPNMPSRRRIGQKDVQKVICACGKYKRLTSEAHCFSCSGLLNTMENKERIHRAKAGKRTFNNTNYKFYD